MSSSLFSLVRQYSTWTYVNWPDKNSASSFLVQPTQPPHQAGFELIVCIGPAGTLLRAAHYWIWLDVVLRVLVAVVRVAKCVGKTSDFARTGYFWNFFIKFSSKGCQSGNQWQQGCHTSPNTIPDLSATLLGCSHTQNRFFSSFDCCCWYLHPHWDKNYIISGEPHFYAESEYDVCLAIALTVREK